jgi:hypothetical protein
VNVAPTRFGLLSEERPRTLYICSTALDISHEVRNLDTSWYLKQFLPCTCQWGSTEIFKVVVYVKQEAPSFLGLFLFKSLLAQIGIHQIAASI